jgi:hypothetical protein
METIDWILWFIGTPQGIILLLPAWIGIGYVLQAVGGAIVVILLGLPVVPISLVWDWARNHKPLKKKGENNGSETV